MILINRKRCTAIFTAAVVAGSCIMSLAGCGKNDGAADNQGDGGIQTAAELADKSADGLAPEAQIALIADTKDTWYVESGDDWINYVGITDFDDNGRLEVTVSREQTGTCVTSQFFMYEVNADGTGIEKVKVDPGDEKQMPDISLNSVTECYRGRDGKLYYSMTDSSMLDYTNYEYINYLMKLENGELSFTKYSRMLCNYSDNAIIEYYYDAADNSIEGQEYTDLEDSCVSQLCGDDFECLYQLLGFHYYDADSDFKEILRQSYTKAARYSKDEYAEYLSDLYGSEQSVSLGIDEIGKLYYTDIDEDYLKNKMWNSFYVFNYETGEDWDYISAGGEESRFEREVIFFGNDGSGYYINQSGEKADFAWSINDMGSGEAVVNGEEYRNSVFGYRMIDNGGIEHQAIAFEFRNEYIYMMCD